MTFYSRRNILWFAVCLFVASYAAARHPATPGAPISEPAVFTSHNGSLDIMMVAKEKAITLADLHPTAWIYEVCPRATAMGDNCPSGGQTAASYAGVRLQLEPGDHLRIRLVNQLPPAPPDDEHANAMPGMLAANPTNLHTHGLIVEPRRAGSGDPTYGDYIYVLGYPQGKFPSMAHLGMDYTDKPIDYDIYIPANHPSGLFWFHPHSHGLALNQVSMGMSGMITVGSVNDYLTKTTRGAPAPTVREMILRDMEVAKDNSPVDQEDPGFCDADPDEGEAGRLGSCAGTIYTDDDGVHDYRGGEWFFTINGQVYPSIDTAPDAGEMCGWSMPPAAAPMSWR